MALFAALGINATELGGDINQQFKRIVTAFVAKARAVHPEKPGGGGSEAAFQAARAAYELLRAMRADRAVTCLVAAANTSGEAHYAAALEFVSHAHRLPWAFFEAVAYGWHVNGDVTSYKVGAAGRAKP